jgi:hypothetical protein
MYQIVPGTWLDAPDLGVWRIWFQWGSLISHGFHSFHMYLLWFIVLYMDMTQHRFSIDFIKFMGFPSYLYNLAGWRNATVLSPERSLEFLCRTIKLHANNEQHFINPTNKHPACLNHVKHQLNLPAHTQSDSGALIFQFRPWTSHTESHPHLEVRRVGSGSVILASRRIL